MPHLIGAHTLDPSQQYCSSNPHSQRRKLAHQSGARNVSLTELPADGAHFCASHTSFGDDRDLATCSIVQILFNGNNLSGSISPTLVNASDYEASGWRRQLEFNNLQALSLENNSLTGRFPIWTTQLPQLAALRMTSNSFSLEPGDANLIADMCNRMGMDCGEGLPGYGGSCLAFGDDMVLLRPEDNDCHSCTSADAVSQAWYLSVLVPGLLAFVIYVAAVHTYANGQHGCSKVIRACASPHPTTLKGWVACSCVVLLHYHTLILVGGVRPFWPETIQTWLACLSLDYACWTKPECVVTITPTLSLNVDQQVSANTLLLFVCLVPPLVLCSMRLLRAYLNGYRRRHPGGVHVFFRDPEPEVEPSADQSPSDVAEPSDPLQVGSASDLISSHAQNRGLSRTKTIKERVLDTLRDTQNIAVVEMICTVCMVALMAPALRVARQLITRGGSFGGYLLLVMQPLASTLYGRDTAAAQRQRKAKVQHSHAKRRIAFLVGPFKDRAATSQLGFLIQHLTIWIGAWYANGGIDAVENHDTGHVIVLLTLIVMWALSSHVEPWETAYMNAASSRLYACHILTLLLGVLWSTYVSTSWIASICHVLLIFTTIGVPMLTIIYLAMGVRVSRASMAAMSDGVLTGTMPIWIRGMRWETLPLPPGSVAIPCINEDTPSSQAVYDALNGVFRRRHVPDADEKREKPRDDGTRRSAEFKRTLDQLHASLTIGVMGSSMTSQVREYGHRAVLKAQQGALKKAKKLTVARLREYGASFEEDFMGAAKRIPDRVSQQPDVAPIPSDASPRQAEPPDLEPAGPAPSADEIADSTAASMGISQTSRVDSALQTLQEQREAVLAAAETARASDAPLEDGAVERALEALDRERTNIEAAVKASRESDVPMEEGAIERALTALETQHGVVAAAAKQASANAPRRNLANDDRLDTLQKEIDAAATAAAAALRDERFADVVVEEGSVAKMRRELAARGANEKGAPVPASPPPSPPQDELPDATLLTGAHRSRMGLAQGTCLARGSSLARSRSGLADGTVLTRRASADNNARVISAAVVLREGTSDRREGIAYGTAAIRGVASSKSLTAGTAAMRGVASSKALAVGTAAMSGEANAQPLAAGTSAARGKSTATSLADGTAAATGTAHTKPLTDGTAALKGGTSARSLSHGTAADTGGTSARSLAEGTAALKGNNAAVALAAGTAAITGRTKSPALAVGTAVVNGRTNAQALTAGTAVVNGRTSAQALADGTAVVNGRTSSQSLASGTVLHGKPATNGLVLAKPRTVVAKRPTVRVHRRAGIAQGTALQRGENATYEGLGAGTVLARIHHTLATAEAATTKLVERAASLVDRSTDGASALVERAALVVDRTADGALALAERGQLQLEAASDRANSLVVRTAEGASALAEGGQLRLMGAARLLADGTTSLAGRTAEGAFSLAERGRLQLVTASEAVVGFAGRTQETSQSAAESAQQQAVAALEHAEAKLAQVEAAREHVVTMATQQATRAHEATADMMERTQERAYEQAVLAWERAEGAMERAAEQADTARERVAEVIEGAQATTEGRVLEAWQRAEALMERSHEASIAQVVAAYERSAALAVHTEAGARDAIHRGGELVERTVQQASEAQERAAALLEHTQYRFEHQAVATWQSAEVAMERAAQQALEAHAKMEALATQAQERAERAQIDTVSRVAAVRAQVDSGVEQFGAAMTVAQRRAHTQAVDAWQKAEVVAARAQAQAQEAWTKAESLAQQAQGGALRAWQSRVEPTLIDVQARMQAAASAVADHPALAKVREHEVVVQIGDFFVHDLLEAPDARPWWNKPAAKRSRAATRRRKLDRNPSQEDGKRRVHSWVPVVQREPPEPPPPPPRVRDASTPTPSRRRNDGSSYLETLVHWLISPASDISGVTETVSVWPTKANRFEPGDEPLDEAMERVIDMIERANYHGFPVVGTHSNDEKCKPLIELGYSAVLCAHMHRNARAESTRAAQIRQRYFVAIIDWRTAGSESPGSASATPPLLAMPNAYMRQWSGRRVRVKEPVFSGGVWARGSDALVSMMRDGRAIVYDESVMSVLALPPGVRVKVLHRAVQTVPVGYSADLLWGDIGALWRNLRGDEAALPFDTPLSEIMLALESAPQLLLAEISHLAEELVGSSAHGEAGDARAVSDAVQRAMGDLVRHQLGNESLGVLARCGQFPKVAGVNQRMGDEVSPPATRDSRAQAGVSIHLCASDTRRLAPDPGREIVVWLTIVDLQQYNPFHATEGGLLTPTQVPFDLRPHYVVPGELACPLSAAEVERRLEEEERRHTRDAEHEINRQLTERLTRARAARRSTGTEQEADLALSPRETFRSEASLAAAAGAIAEAQLGSNGAQLRANAPLNNDA